MRVALVGAGGTLGREVARELAARGHPTVAFGRDAARVRRALTEVDVAPEAVVEVDLHDRAGLRERLREAAPDVVVDAVGAPSLDLLRTVIELGCHAVDLTADAHAVRERVAELEVPARTAGITVVVGAGVVGLPGDLLAATVAGAVTRPREVHVAYVLPDGGLRRSLARGARDTVAGLFGRPSLIHRDHELVEEPLAEVRRLAWFPRPVGPHHAVGVPGLEALSVPRHQPALRVVRTYLAVPSWRAEILQLLGHVARSPRWRPRVAAWAVGRREVDPTPPQRAATRWAVVAETEGEEGVARAWMNGRDLYGSAALAAVLLVERLGAGRAAEGVVPPALVDVPGELLDELAARSTSRWSVIRPG